MELKSKVETKNGLRVNVTRNIRVQWPRVGVWGKRHLYGRFNCVSSFPHVYMGVTGFPRGGSGGRTIAYKFMFRPFKAVLQITIDFSR